MSGAPDDDQSFLNSSAAIQYRLLPLPGNLSLEFGGISIKVVNSQTIRKKPPQQCHTNVDVKNNFNPTYNISIFTILYIPEKIDEIEIFHEDSTDILLVYCVKDLLLGQSPYP